MKISRQNKQLYLEQEMVALLFIIVLSVALSFYYDYPLTFLIVFVAGFALYFWMLFEEKIHPSGLKHEYFEHTSSYFMFGQTAFALCLLFLAIGARQNNMLYFLMLSCMTIAVIMYSVGLSRVVMYKVVFR